MTRKNYRPVVNLYNESLRESRLRASVSIHDYNIGPWVRYGSRLCRGHHATETALISVLGNLLVFYRGYEAIPIMLHYWAAFETIDQADSGTPRKTHMPLEDLL